MTTEWLIGIRDEGNIPDGVTPGELYEVVCDQIRDRKTIERVREILHSLPIRIDSAELAQTEMVVLYLSEARELAELLKH